jgi:ArsR family transcriptional regulator, virulence genes transcriptional regulator
MESKHNLEFYRLKAELCKTFADPKRLIIINELREGERSVGDLAEALDSPQAVVSRHLAILRERGVVTTRREGTRVHYSLVDEQILQACDAMQECLMRQLERRRDLAQRLSP